MSRSVKQDYDKLRAAQAGGHVYVQEASNIRYLGALVPKTDEMFFNALSIEDVRYVRKTEPYNVSPTNEDWAKYHRAKNGLLALQAYADTRGLEDVEIPMPKPKTKHRYIETQEAWLERCHALMAEGIAA